MEDHVLEIAGFESGTGLKTGESSLPPTNCLSSCADCASLCLFQNLFGSLVSQMNYIRTWLSARSKATWRIMLAIDSPLRRAVARSLPYLFAQSQNGLNASRSWPNIAQPNWKQFASLTEGLDQHNPGQLDLTPRGVLAAPHMGRAPDATKPTYMQKTDKQKHCIAFENLAGKRDIRKSVQPASIPSETAGIILRIIDKT